MITIRNHARWKTNPVTTDGYLNLVATMFQRSLTEAGLPWLRGPCGRCWLDVSGLQFDAVFRGMMGRQPTAEEREPLADCHGCELEWRGA